MILITVKILITLLPHYQELTNDIVSQSYKIMLINLILKKSVHVFLVAQERLSNLNVFRCSK